VKQNRKKSITTAENIEAKERINFKKIHFEKWHEKRKEAEMIIFLLKMWWWVESSKLG
jgi:hypothetical protein